MPIKKSKGDKKSGNIDHFLALSDREKEAVYRSVDREIPFSETSPLSRSERTRWNQGRHVRGKKIKPAATQKVSVNIEQDLLAEVDRYADEHGLRRTELVSVGLRMAMASGVGVVAGRR
jgi:hypothetical protein